MEEQRIGRYVIVKEIGRGGQSYAYLARDPAIGRTVAIKQIRAVTELPEEMRSEFVTRFLQEARVAGTLSHPNIVSVFDMGESEAGPYIVMEYVDGQSLDQLIQGPTPPTRDEVIGIFLQICSGLSFAHNNGIVHRDVKPANIMLTKDGRVKLVDFGVARVDSGNLTQTGTLLGTPSYMSPEQIQGEKVDRRSDIFSLGVVLYETLTRRLPFAGENPTTMIFRIVNDPYVPLQDVDASLAGDFGPIIDRCLAKSPDERYQDCDELAEDLRRFSSTLSASQPASGVERGGAGAREGDTSATLISSPRPRAGADSQDETAVENEEHSPLFGMKRNHLALLAGAGALVLLLLIGIGAIYWSRGMAESTTADSLGASTPALELLQEAKQAVEDGRLVGDAGDNALALARDALALGETSAQDTIDEIRKTLRERTLAEARDSSPSAAASAFDEFLRHFPEDEEIRNRRQQVESRGRQVQQERRSEDFAAQGRAALEKGNLKVAARNFNKLLEVSPDDFYATYMLGKTEAAAGELKTASQSLSRAASLSPLDPGPQLDLAEVLEKLGRGQEAADSLRKAIELGASQLAGEGVLEKRLQRLELRSQLADILPIEAEVKHSHFMLLRSCRGRLFVDANSIRYQPEKKDDHAFQFQLDELNSFEVSGQELTIEGPDGKKYKLEEIPEKAAMALTKLQALRAQE